MSNHPDLAGGCIALDRLIDDISKQGLDLNEADTRHQFIDRLIHECLGWDRSLTKLERRFGETYSDYELGLPPQIVIEAKRAGVSFAIPSQVSPRLVRTIQSLSAASKEFRSAFDQAQAYCAERGIQIGVVCNSTQVIVFLGVRNDGVPPSQGNCLVFNGWEHLKKNFSHLWDAISPDAEGRKLLLKELAEAMPTGVPQKLSTQLSGYPGVRYPSESQQSLRTLSDLLIEDAPNTPAVQKKFLEECYCENGALAKEALVGKNILSARYAAMFSPSAENPMLTGVRASPDDKFGISSEVVAEALGRRPIVIMGDVGVGKTSFVKNLIFVKAADELARAIFLYIDLGSQAALGQDLQGFLIKEIERQLLQDHQVDITEDSFVRAVYHGDLIRFEKGIYGPLKTSAPEKFLDKQIEHLSELMRDKVEHLKKSIAHLAKGRRKQVVISIDNADQRELEDQQRAFLAAQEFASNWQALVLISLRPQTYFASKLAGALSAYPQRILTISPPRIDLVLQKRLNFSLDLAEGRLPLERLDGISIRLDAIALFLKALLVSLARNKEIIELLTNITGGNIREVLELIKGFIGSSNVDSDKIIEIMRSDGDYIIPLHEFTKQALLGQYSHYHERSSIAFNLFDVRYPDPREHFLSAFILGYLLQDGGHRNKDGFVECSQILNEMQAYSFVPEQVEYMLRRLANKKLIEATELVTFNEGLQGLVGDMPAAFRVTTIGAYHIQKWMATFSYLDAMVFDTPIFDEVYRRELGRFVESFDIKARLSRVTGFIAYLDSCWSRIQRSPNYFDWPTQKAMGEQSFAGVNRFVAARQNH